MHITDEQREKNKANALALTVEQRKSLTWEEADRFVLSDELLLSRWAAMKAGKLATPWMSLSILLRLDH